jgi:hypothetical protein
VKDLRDEHDAQKICWPDLVYYLIIFDIRKAYFGGCFPNKNNSDKIFEGNT